jgi:uncharacterized SAM-binding protein YcdF (DUF218 family)
MFEISYSVLMPPMSLLVAIPLGAVIALRWRKSGVAVVLISSLLLLGFCTPFLSERLLDRVEEEIPGQSSDGFGSAQAIVVLEGDMRYGSAGPQSDDVGSLTLQRLRRAAELYRAHPLPVLMSGGPFARRKQSGAAIMARVFQSDYGITATWLEEKSANTFENAAYSAAILKAHQITKVIIVTQSWHMPRAVWSFEHAGIVPIPGATARIALKSFKWTDIMPDYASFSRSFFALHESIGLVYYRYRYSVPSGAAG